MNHAPNVLFTLSVMVEPCLRKYSASIVTLAFGVATAVCAITVDLGACVDTPTRATTAAHANITMAAAATTRAARLRFGTFAAGATASY